MIELSFDIELDGKEYHVTSNKRDLVNLEAHFASHLDQSLTHFMFLGWSALHRLELFDGTWDDFLDSDADVAVSTAGDAHPLDQTSPSSDKA